MKTVDVCLSDRMITIMLSHSWQRLVLIGLMGMTLTKCTFAAVVVRNARWFFRTPEPAPRRDLPRSDDAELSVLWIGHATCLVQIGDRYILTDPVFTELVGGFSRRLVAASLQPPALPNNLTVVVSHRHFDHLSKDSLRLTASHIQHVVTPVGAGDDIPESTYQTHELAWWTTWEDNGLKITAVPAVHEGNRFLHDESSHPSAFGGYVLEYRGHRVYFPGDTAYRQELFAAIAARVGAIDLALMPIGPIAPTEMMLSHHMNPSQALQATEDLQAEQMVPVHFGAYMHSFDDPGDCERAFDAALLARPALQGSAHRIAIGERRVIIGNQQQEEKHE